MTDKHTILLAELRPRIMNAKVQLCKQEPAVNWQTSSAIRKLLDEALKARGL